MKKIFILAEAALGMLAACTEIERSEMAGPQGIGFNVYSARATKATAIVDIDVLKTSGFQVAARFGTDEYFPATKVIHNNTPSMEDYAGYFVPEISRYWPYSFGGKTLEFFATNASIVDQAINAKTGTFSYTTGSSTAVQQDLVVADKVTASNVINEDNIAGNWVTAASAEYRNGCVDLQFRHALTKINFSFKGQDADLLGGYKYTIESLTLDEIDQTSTYTFGNPGSWGTLSNSGTVTYGTGVGDLCAFIYSARHDMEENLMIIPQEGKYNASGTNGTTHVKCSIKYKVETPGGVVISNYTDSDGGNGARTFYIPVTVTTPAITKSWSQNAAFRYVIEIPAGQNPITFAAKVAAWDDEVTGLITF